MRSRWMVGSFLAFALAAGAACSSSSASGVATGGDAGDTSDGGADDAAAADAAETGPAACTLRKEDGTGVAKCDDCLQKKCCQVIEDCMTDTDCKALSDCYGSCYDLGAKSDAGVQCVRDCLSEHKASSLKFQNALECENTSCSSACQG